ncbi:hypothetical protein EDD11_000172 [Mortierella claussenii]|nr:hypothetical protein EDD11_000172 [Mortierella claussenii]
MPTILAHPQSAVDELGTGMDAPTATVPTPCVSSGSSTHLCQHLQFPADSPLFLSNSPSPSISPPRTPTFAPSFSDDNTPSRSPVLRPMAELVPQEEAQQGQEQQDDRPRHQPQEPGQRQQNSFFPPSPPVDESAPFKVMTHPAVVFASERLLDPNYACGFHTVDVFDFDQTLFQSPLPNPALWDPSFLGILTSWNYCGTGWWHNPGTLELGPEAEATCWEGWWNEEIVQKVHESSRDPGCLTVLLTGRNGPTFGQKLIEMVNRKGMDFDLIATKPTTVARIKENSIDNNNSINNHTSKKTTAVSPTKRVSSKAVERYLKVHTFNTKHDFLYNILYEYPSIRSMRLWDDRPCQIAKFRQVGQEWLDNKMLDHFEITAVQEPLLFMDPARETELVLKMVEANNQQVDIEASGGPFLVPGVGPIPRTRPELNDRNIWDPYETYVPQTRIKIEVTKVVRYTGVMFSEAVQRFFNERFGNGDVQQRQQHQWIQQPDALSGQDLAKWVVPDDLHVTLCLGTATEEHLQSIGGLGATVLVEVDAVGQCEERIWALRVKELDVSPDNDQDPRALQIVAPNGQVYSSLDELRLTYASSTSTTLSEPLHESSSELTPDSTTIGKESCLRVNLDRLGHIVLKRDGTPHITMAYDRLNGTRAVDSGRITTWEPLTTCSGKPYPYRLIFVGTIGEKRLLGMKSKKPSPQKAAEVSVGNIIKSLTGDKDISGKELGVMIRHVKEDMERLSVENRVENEERIATIAQEVCDRAETRKSSTQQSPVI